MVRREGVTDRRILDELKARSVEEVACVTRYVPKSRSNADPRRTGLLVHLLRRGVAATDPPQPRRTTTRPRAYTLPAASTGLNTEEATCATLSKAARARLPKEIAPAGFSARL